MGEEFSAGACKFTAQEFQMPMSYLPKLKSIDVSSSHNFKFYMDCLCDMDNTKYLQHIEEIYKGSNVRPTKRHSQACYNFCASLTQLSVCYCDYGLSEIENGDNAASSVLKRLSKFEKLVDLEIRYNLDGSLTPFDILQVCPTLINLKCSSSTIPGDRMDEEFSKPPNAINATLQNLDLHLPKLTANYITNLKVYFPAGSSKKLHVAMDGTDLHGWTQSIGKYVALDFAHYMGSFSDTCLAICLPSSGVSNNAESAMPAIFRLIGK